MSDNQKGFTLVEISIVFAIIAIIVGGIIKGQSLMQSAQITSAINEYSNLHTAIKQYYDKYGGYAGDDGTGTQTANDDLIGAEETVKAWKELYDQKYLKTAYTGTVTSYNHGGGSINSYSVIDKVAGQNAPTSSIENSGEKSGFQLGITSLYWDDQTFLRLGSHAHNPSSTANTLLTGGALNPKDAAKIDKKIDDSYIYSGLVRGQNGTGETTCHTGFSKSAGNEPVGSYNKANANLVCSLIFFFELPAPQ